MLTRVLGCDYDPPAECREWRRHLALCLPDENVRSYFEEVVGYSLTGLRTEQMMVMLQGTRSAFIPRVRR